jgi:hypothetical protein
MGQFENIYHPASGGAKTQRIPLKMTLSRRCAFARIQTETLLEFAFAGLKLVFCCMFKIIHLFCSLYCTFALNSVSSFLNE